MAEHAKSGREEDSLGLGSWGMNPEEEKWERGKTKTRSSFSSLQEKENGMDTSEARARASVEEGR